MTKEYIIDSSGFENYIIDAEKLSISYMDGFQCVAEKFQHLNHNVSDKLIGAVDNLFEIVSKYGYGIITGLPVDKINLANVEKSTCISETMLSSLISRFGKPYGYNTQRHGAVIQNMTPNKKANNSCTPSGTSYKGLYWHTEDAALKYNCDYIALFCLRNDPETITFVSHLDDLELSHDIFENLCKPEYEILPDGSYLTYQNKIHPVIELKDKNTKIYRVDPEYTNPLTVESKNAFKKLIELADESKVDIILKPGDLLVFDNRKCIHGRSDINYKSPNELRWLQRVMFFEKSVPDEILDKNRMNIILSSKMP